MIDSKTRIVGVIGNPVEHSMSPAMHNAAFSEIRLNYAYLAFRVTDLSSAVKGIRALNVRGCNVTIPHKVEVMKYLDEIDGIAAKIGAVNTVVNEGGVLTGYNTDCSGAVDALLEKTKLKGKKVMILGAGGASRAVAFGALEKGAIVTVVNRTEEKARGLADDLCKYFPGRVMAGPAEAVKDCDVLVNTTSVGMHPDAGKSPVEKRFLRRGLAVMDIVYNPVETRLLRDAKDAGCVTISGVEMFVNQGALSFEMFTGKKAPKDVMRETVLKMLSV